MVSELIERRPCQVTALYQSGLLFTNKLTTGIGLGHNKKLTRASSQISSRFGV